jgi:hypothetical protein
MSLVLPQLLDGRFPNLSHIKMQPPEISGIFVWSNVEREVVSMQLQQRLDQQKQRFLSSGKASPEMIGIMQRSTEQLRSSGILQRVLKPGQKAPSFQLPNHDSVLVDSSNLLESGSLVVSFFRGVW